jgi:carbonic anhydrase
MKIISISKQEDIPQKYLNTPIEKLLLYNNFGIPFDNYDCAKLLIGMCMDNRNQLRIPENFAFIIRTGGANIRYSEFKVSYAIAVGGVKFIMILSHNNCGMVNLMSKKKSFVNGLVENANWDRVKAEDHFMNYAPMFELDNGEQFVIDEAERLRKKYNGIIVVPAYYQIEDNKVHLLED